MSFKISGKLPSGKLKERIQLSPNYKDGAFQNLSITPMKQEGVTYWKMTKEFLKKHPDTAPPAKLPFVKTDLNKLNRDEPVIVWFGHSSYFIRIENKNFLIDPVFSGNAAPFSFMVKAFRGSNNYKAEDMPAIDYLILTHDHYDHLDFKTIRKLKSKVNKIYCSLGLCSHLKHVKIANIPLPLFFVRALSDRAVPLEANEEIPFTLDIGFIRGQGDKLMVGT